MKSPLACCREPPWRTTATLLKRMEARGLRPFERSVSADPGGLEKTVLLKCRPETSPAERYQGVAIRELNFTR